MAEVETEISENATPLTAARKEHDDAHTALRAMEPPAALPSNLAQPLTSPLDTDWADPKKTEEHAPYAEDDHLGADGTSDSRDGG